MSRKYSRDQAEAVFWARVSRSDDCWLWTGAIWGSNGYGCARWDGRARAAHRVAWSLFNGEVPCGTNVLHRCDNPTCVNPAHLFLGTHTDNMRDMAAKGRARNQHQRATACKRGHPFTPENTRHDGRGRQCRICDRLRPSYLRKRGIVEDAKAKDRWE